MDRCDCITNNLKIESADTKIASPFTEVVKPNGLQALSYCHSTNFYKSGFTRGKQRYKCKDC
ncbi:MAG: hypothetical protein LBU65_08690, partial [Planctomycetaceae bacterium]|nr:hypothetical protein [Planctomycetaceae bacterium]